MRSRHPLLVWTFLGIGLGLGVAAPCGVARAQDIDVYIENGDKVTGTVNPPGEVETFRFVVPEGAVLDVSAKPKTHRERRFPPTLFVRVVNANGVDAAPGLFQPKGKGTRLADFVVPATGEYAIEVRGDGFDRGDYQLKLKWKTPKSAKEKGLDLSGGGAVTFTADAGSLLAFTAKRSKRSTALVAAARLVFVPDFGPEVEQFVFDPAGPGKAHKERDLPLRTTGRYRLEVVDLGAGGGTADVVLKLKPASQAKRKIGIRDEDLGGFPEGVTLFASAIADARGVTASDPESANQTAARSSLTVGPGVLRDTEAVFIGLAPEFAGPALSGLLPAGPAVYAGPDGLEYPDLVRIVFPFDLSAFDGDTSTLRVVRRDASGTPTVTSLTGLIIDAVEETVSVQFGKGGTFAAFRLVPSPVASSVFPFRGDSRGEFYEITIFGTGFRDVLDGDGEHVLKLVKDGVVLDAEPRSVDAISVTFLAPGHVGAGRVTFGVLDTETGLVANLPTNSFEYF